MIKSKITLNVLENISNKVRHQGFSTKVGKALVVFNGSQLEDHSRIMKLKELKEKGVDMSIGFSFMAEKVIDKERVIDILRPMEIYREEDIVNFPNIIHGYSLLIGPNITMNSLSKVALGMIDSFVPNIIWTFLYQGKKVYLDFYSVRKYLGGETKSKEILNIIENHIDSLEKMGAIEIKEDDYLEKIVIESNTLKNTLNDLDIIKDNLITERDIKELSITKKVITIDKNTIITPLAKDKARELGIKIDRKI